MSSRSHRDSLEPAPTQAAYLLKLAPTFASEPSRPAGQTAARVERSAKVTATRSRAQGREQGLTVRASRKGIGPSARENLLKVSGLYERQAQVRHRFLYHRPRGKPHSAAQLRQALVFQLHLTFQTLPFDFHYCLSSDHSLSWLGHFSPDKLLRELLASVPAVAKDSQLRVAFIYRKHSTWKRHMGSVRLGAHLALIMISSMNRPQ